MRPLARDGLHEAAAEFKEKGTTATAGDSGRQRATAGDSGRVGFGVVGIRATPSLACLGDESKRTVSSSFRRHSSVLGGGRDAAIESSPWLPSNTPPGSISASHRASSLATSLWYHVVASDAIAARSAATRRCSSMLVQVPIYERGDAGEGVRVAAVVEMSVAKEFQAANESYVASFANAHLPLPPSRKVAVVTCMDARLDPAKSLGLTEGDAHVIRNAGGRAVDALRSVIISQQLLGTREIAVIHHTDCGMLTFNDSDLRGKIRSDLGENADHIAFLPFDDLEASVADDVAVLKNSPLVLDVPISGYVYDVKTGRINKV
ncbi:carbonic anhydrase [Drechmeria coniospora]|uniref:Carbonic anhydrase n=1 Tax=Drechmeria coniospora TaxID=98403 RepID=A0A151GA93_DRECN|nr:carbonic anhydrase [Drechmeria coniospora]KYK54006.1 carbonic anhydrase [Drechmeria coniospora]